MGWPRTTAPAWPVHAGFAAACVGVGVAYPLASPGGRAVIYLLVTLVPIGTFVAALRARHLSDRWLWVTAIVGLVLLTLSVLLWPDWITGHHLGRAEASPASLFIAAAHMLFFVGCGGALRRHARSDSAGLLDAALFGICSSGPIWMWLFAPHLGPGTSQFGEMLVLADLMVLSGMLGCLFRLGLTAKKARATIGYLLLCCLLTLAGDLAAVLTVHATATWTAELMMMAYLAMAMSPLHPGAAQVTFPGVIKEVTGEPPLVWIGASLCANPAFAAAEVLRGDASAGLLLPIGSLLVVPLVLLRLKQMSAQRAGAERTLAHHAHHDELTGLVNRRRITAEIDRALAALGRGELEQVTVLVCDLDGFKPINDGYGHQAGDAVLKTVAARLLAGARDSDMVGRIGGDEFLILRHGGKPADDPADGLDSGVDRLADMLRRPIPIGPEAVRVGISIGAATARRGEEIDRDTLIGRADAEMYAVKATRRLARETAGAFRHA